MAGISFGGLASGMDTNGIIDALVKIERIPITQLTQRQQDINDAKSQISNFSSRLANLQTAAAALADSSGFSAFSATSSSSNIVATVNGNASAGAFDVTVKQLAREQRSYSTAMDSDTGAIAGLVDGNLRLTVDGYSAVDVAINAGDSLAGIAARINQSGARVAASVIYNGSKYVMQLRGLDLAANVDYSTGTDATTLATLGMSNYQTAQKSKIVIDGNTIERKNNQISDVINGVTLTLTKEDETNPVKVQVASDINALSGKVKAFVNAYNQVIYGGHSVAGFGDMKASNAMTAGDSAVRASLSKLSSIITTTVSGTTGKYTMLASVGLGTSRDGSISYNESTLTKALTADPASVAKLFITDTSLGATGIMKTISDAAKTLTQSGGTVANRIDMFNKQSAAIDKSITSLNDRVAATQERLKKQFAEMETVVNKYKSAGNALASLSSMNYSSSK